MDKTLNVNDPKQVSSPKMLDIFLGTPQYHLLIYTGIAIPESVINSDDPDDTIHDRIAINFGHPIDRNGRPITITGLINYTATVGLASFGNDTTDFLFATDDVAVSLLNGELVLQSQLRTKDGRIGGEVKMHEYRRTDRRHQQSRAKGIEHHQAGSPRPG
jgi:hypothetical protein